MYNSPISCSHNLGMSNSEAFIDRTTDRRGPRYKRERTGQQKQQSKSNTPLKCTNRWSVQGEGAMPIHATSKARVKKGIVHAVHDTLSPSTRELSRVLCLSKPGRRAVSRIRCEPYLCVFCVVLQKRITFPCRHKSTSKARRMNRRVIAGTFVNEVGPGWAERGMKETLRSV